MGSNARDGQALERVVRDLAQSPALCARCGTDPLPPVPGRDALAKGMTVDALGVLTRMAELRRLVAEVERLAVAQARKDGLTWALIGKATGVTGQAVAQKHAR